MFWILKIIYALELTYSNPLQTKYVEGLKSSSLAQAQTLKKAYDAYTEKKFDVSIRLLSNLLKHPEWEEHGLYWKAKNLAEKALQQKSIKLYSQAIELLQQIDHRFLFSMYRKQLSKQIAQWEQQIALLYFAQNAPLKAITFAEQAFARSLPGFGLESFEQESIKKYLTACNALQRLECNEWSSKLLSQSRRFPQDFEFAKKSLEEIVKVKLAQNYREPQKITQMYRAIDQDVQSYHDILSLSEKQNWSDLNNKLLELLKKFPRTSLRKNVLFWSAYATDQQKDSACLKAYSELYLHYPLSFYGAISYFKEQKDFKGLTAQKRAIVFSYENSSLSVFDRMHLAKAQAFFLAGLNDLAMQAVGEIKFNESLPNEVLIGLVIFGSLVKNYIFAFSAFSELLLRDVRDILDTSFLELIFPLEYMDLVEQAASFYKIDPIMLLSLIKQESAFMPKVISRSGAVGLGQIMPKTALELDSAIDSVSLFDPKTNIFLSAKYLSQLLQKFNGYVPFVLAAYNAGPAAANRWINNVKFDEEGLYFFVDRISYRETREYVTSILRNIIWYSMFLKKNFDSIETLWKLKLDSPSAQVLKKDEDKEKDK